MFDKYNYNFFYIALFYDLNSVRVKIDPRQGGCLGLCTLVYETVILIMSDTLWKFDLGLKSMINDTNEVVIA